MLINTPDPKDMGDAEREAHIKSCGDLMQKAMDDGNREEAMNWLQAQNQAIAMRSPAQVERMEIERGLRGESCYFVTMGELAHPAILRRQAA